jgi:hypothetical protein
MLYKGDKLQQVVTVCPKVLSLQCLEGLQKATRYQGGSGPWVERCTNLF